MSIKLGIKAIKSAFPHLSPRPFIVPCTWRTPASIAAKLQATAVPESLWQWIPNGTPGMLSLTSFIILVISCGRVPPLVSQRTTHFAPASKAERTHSNANFLLFLKPSKKCSQSNSACLPLLLISLIDSLIMSIFSSRVIFSALLTWKSHVFPTRHTESDFPLRTAFKPGSLAALVFGLLVIPNATKFETFNFGGEPNNLSSVGFAPGQPPSM